MYASIWVNKKNIFVVLYIGHEAMHLIYDLHAVLPLYYELKLNTLYMILQYLQQI